MLKIAEIESSFDPNAKNPNSSAGGLFQFINTTASDYGLSNRYDPAQAADAAARLAKNNAAHLRHALGREPTVAELYLAHQQGAGGAAKLLANPNTAAAAIVGAEAVRLNGGREGMTAGEFAGLWLKKAGGDLPAVPGGRGAGNPLSIPTQPLALRRDGTIYGEAFDRAAISAYGWRLDQGLSNDLFAAHEEFGDDPQAFAARMGEIRTTYLQDESLADPEVREIFEKSFSRRAEAYARDVASRHGRRLDGEQKAAAGEALDARVSGLEKEAYLLGANPDGDRILGEQVDRAMRSIDAAVAEGSITPDQAQKWRGKIRSGTMTARLHGVYDALETPDARKEFALGLMQDEALLSEFGFAEVRAISDQLFNRAIGDARRTSAADKIGNARLEGLIADDIASLEATGAGLDPSDSGLSADLVSGRLGPEKLAAWQEARRRATLAYQATAGMEAESEADLLARLEQLQPEAGAEGYAEQEAIFAHASKRAEAVLKERSRDPAAAAEKAFAEVADLASAADPANPESMQALVSARLQAQAALGIGEFGQDPLTRREASDLSQALLQFPSGSPQQVQAARDLVAQVEAAYGPHAELVLAQVVGQTGVDRDTSRLAAGLMSRIASGERPPVSAAESVDVMAETAAAESAGRQIGAMAGRSRSVFPTPSYDAIQMLLSSPETAAQFDEVFGPGASQTYLKPRAPSPAFREDGGTTTFDESGAENWQPDGDR
jgi:hypothetical protein